MMSFEIMKNLTTRIFGLDIEHCLEINVEV